MLTNVYLFALVLGFILLGASLLMGGDNDSDADFDADADADFGGDADFGDADFDADAGLGDADASHDTHGDLGGFFGVLGSTRFWMFFSAFFGLTGIIFDVFELAKPMVSLGLAIGVGFVTGWTAVTLIRRLSANDTGVAAGVDDYVGKSGEMLLAAGPGRIGKLRIELKGTTVDVLAESEEPIAKGEQALIVAMHDHKASVVKLDSARAMARA